MNDGYPEIEEAERAAVAMTEETDVRREPSPAEGLRAVSEALDSVRQAALPARSIAEPVWQERNDPWVPLRALDNAMTGLPCPARSSLTDQPCVLTLWHPSDGIRFHRFALTAEPDRPSGDLDTERLP